MKYKVMVEMEAWNLDGTENEDLWEEVIVDADSLDHADEIAANMDFGVRSPCACSAEFISEGEVTG